MTHFEPRPEGQTRFEQRFLYFAIEQAVSPYLQMFLGARYSVSQKHRQRKREVLKRRQASDVPR